MKIVRCIAALFIAGVLSAACADVPTAPDAQSALGVVPSRDVILDPIIVIGQPGQSQCDPYFSLDWCEGGGSGQCMMSSAGATGPEATMMSCPGEGNGGGGDSPIGGGGSTGDGAGSTAVTGTGPFAEGPLLWAACVVAVVGGTFSVNVVADKFVAWYDAHKALVRAQNAVNYARTSQQRGDPVEPAALELAYYRLEAATQARDAAVADVEEATGVSILTLLGAGFTCGAALVAPTA